MKICPICDGKVTGNWCKSCHRFITPWELKNDIYINECHSAKFDEHCEYHNPTTQYDSQEYMKPGYEKRIYGGADTHTGKSSSGSKSSTRGNVKTTVRTNSTTNSGSGAERKTGKGKKVVRWVIWFYIITFVLGVIGSIYEEYDYEIETWIEEQVEKFFEGQRTPEDDKYDEYEDYDDYDDYEFVYKSYDELRACTPVTTEKEEDYQVIYYDVEDVKKYGDECDNWHMDLEIQEFKDDVLWTLLGDLDHLIDDMACESEDNYLIIDTEDNAYGCFDSYYYAYDEEKNICILSSYDTYSDRLHYYMVYIPADEMNDDYVEALVRWSKKYGMGDPLGDEKEVRKMLEQVIKSGDDRYYYTYLYNVDIYLSGDGYIIMSVEPNYE
ncbi:MAG: hypothetical protein ACI4AQ_08575 [Lachnospiraceae bacterium]